MGVESVGCLNRAGSFRSTGSMCLAGRPCPSHCVAWKQTPVAVAGELLGIPVEDGRRLDELTEIMNSGAVGDTHAEHSHVLDAHTDLECNMFFLLLINAGGDTTRKLVAAGNSMPVRFTPSTVSV